ncbi:MAG TPA: YggT family protein [Rhodospirillaceae bacterium]|nr:YggT family protein [Rhodospirillaceae bacterium]
MGIIAYLINLAFQIYTMIIIVQVIISWLVNFGVVNTGNQQARNLIELLRKLTDPVYKPIQKYIPPIGGIDITPLVVIIGLSLIQSYVVNPVLFRTMGGFY